MRCHIVTLGEVDEPIFVLDVTMQNHGGFAIDDYDFEKEISVEGIDNVPKTEEYLSLIRESDRAFEELIQYFSKVEEPTIGSNVWGSSGQHRDRIL